MPSSSKGSSSSAKKLPDRRIFGRGPQIQRANLEYLEEVFELCQIQGQEIQDQNMQGQARPQPLNSSLREEWQRFFRGAGLAGRPRGAGSETAAASSPGLSESRISGKAGLDAAPGNAGASNSAEPQSGVSQSRASQSGVPQGGVPQSSRPPAEPEAGEWRGELSAAQLLQSYRESGSLAARLNPLEDSGGGGWPPGHSLPAAQRACLPGRPLGRSPQGDFHISERDLDREFAAASHLFGQKKPLREAIQFLERAYCGRLALQAGGCPPEVRSWLFREFEGQKFSLTKKQKLQAFASLAEAECLEKFLHSRFPGKKRFSIEGLDVLMPMLEYILEKGAADLEMRDLTIGMAHRGRVNVLINLMRQDPRVIFSEFAFDDSRTAKEANDLLQAGGWTGDVKYHLGFSSERETSAGPCRLYLGYNPSHLEAVNPVICGMTRALQRRNRDTQRRKSAVPVLIHGDGSFCGQGSAAETLQLSQLKGYTTGGAIHIILNNQLGFTTSPAEGRSTPFPSDLAKSIQAPALLVNADGAEPALRAADIALRFRHQFGSDIFIELIGYRRHGHNEGDEPSFTQPLMYKKIKSHPTALRQYRDQLIKEGLITKERAEALFQERTDKLERSLQSLKSPGPKIKKEDWTGKKLKTKKKPLRRSQASKADLEEVFQALCAEPPGASLHPKIKKILQKRRRAIQEDRLDWGLCELAAYGTLLKEGFSVRLTGQDSKRGTFSHRHAVYWDCETGGEIAPLKRLAKGEGLECCLYNSPLSEMAVLAFEYGNSCLAPDFLTLWEAQFGDFANGAQIILDQFIASGEMKWMQRTDIALLLPHGYEGQGPEHSSAYLERFLQLAAQGNMRIGNITRPANLFHALRRQKVLLRERKPLVIMAPKSLLRHPEAVSSAKDLIHGKFEEVLWDQSIQDPRDIRSAVLCSGKVFYDLERERRAAMAADRSGASHIEDGLKAAARLAWPKMAVFRLEQLYPFPESSLNPILNGFSCLEKIIWLQEEPKNRGAWSYVEPRLRELLEAVGQRAKIYYAGRPAMAAAAEGSEAAHKAGQRALIERCLRLV